MNSVRGAGAILAVAVLVAACSSSAGSTDAPAAASSGPPAQGSVSPAASSETAADAVATYRTYLETNTDLLVQRTKAFTDAVIANKLTEARDLYAPAPEPTTRPSSRSPRASVTSTRPSMPARATSRPGPMGRLSPHREGTLGR